jgi:hypothetical protein
VTLLLLLTGPDAFGPTLLPIMGSVYRSSEYDLVFAPSNLAYVFVRSDGAILDGLTDYSFTIEQAQPQLTASLRDYQFALNTDDTPSLGYQVFIDPSLNDPTRSK